MFAMKIYKNGEKLDEENFFSFQTNLIAFVGKYNEAGYELTKNIKFDETIPSQPAENENKEVFKLQITEKQKQVREYLKDKRELYAFLSGLMGESFSAAVSLCDGYEAICISGDPFELWKLMERTVRNSKDRNPIVMKFCDRCSLFTP